MPDPSPPEPQRPPPGSFLSWFHRIERHVHERSLALLNMQPAEREEQVHLMLANRQRGAVEYWTFLVLSMAIATLGLAMDSTTVVIGAMLVSPLMGPIVEFAMGLVVGSPVLTVRSVLRILGSVVVVIAGAALMTLILPFHEVTPEIAARTEPTLMDLALAGFVALAATLTVVKAKNETNIVAAGAAIGIALVPPVCVVGFGLGIADPEIAGGASLLLVTNFTAIIFVGVVFFYLLGYEQVSVREWDDEALDAAPPGSTIRRVLMGADRVFGSSHGRLFRVLVPALVFGLLAVPLSRALDRVSWEIRARSAVRRILADLPTNHDYVQTSHSVSYGEVGVRTYVVGGSVATTDSLRAELSTRIAAATGVEPDVRVIAVPNYGALRRVVDESAREPARSEPSRDVELAGLRQELAAALERAWPLEAYGPLLGWRVELSDSGDVELRVRLVGPAPDAGAAQLLATALGPDAPPGLRVRFAPLDTARLSASAEDALAWLPTLVRTLEAARTTPRVDVCVEIPDPNALRSAPRDARLVADAVPALLDRLPPERYALSSNGETFATRLLPHGLPTPGTLRTATDAEGSPAPRDPPEPAAENGEAAPTEQTTAVPESGVGSPGSGPVGACFPPSGDPTVAGAG